MLKKIRQIYNLGLRYKNDPYHNDAYSKAIKEITKSPIRTEVINFLFDFMDKKDSTYLEIGVRNPDDNFNKINAYRKYSVDPGVEFKTNPVDFCFTSDDFFKKLRKGEILKSNIKFDLIFIDGLHTAEQVERDIANALDFIDDRGFIVLHDCNPPTEFHARECYYYRLSPAGGNWNGTTWKAFFKYRKNENLYSCCIDTDWGIGILSRNINIGEPSTISNHFFEYDILDKNRFESLNLIKFDDFKRMLQKF